jgi:hypothetical protein
MGESVRSPIQQLIGDLDIPRSYPSDTHVQIHELAHQCFTALVVADDVQSELRSGLNSMVYRFKSCVESGDAFSQSVIAHGAAPPQPQRYYQERDFFLFVMSGATCLESMVYALFAWGAAIHPTDFPFDTDAQRRQVSIQTAASAYGKIDQGDQLANALRSIRGSNEYNEWMTLRRVLFHRGLPGRVIRFSTGPTEPTSRYHAFADLGGIEVHPDSISSMLTWLATILESTLSNALAMMQSQANLWIDETTAAYEVAGVP